MCGVLTPCITNASQTVVGLSWVSVLKASGKKPHTSSSGPHDADGGVSSSHTARQTSPELPVPDFSVPTKQTHSSSPSRGQAALVTLPSPRVTNGIPLPSSSRSIGKFCNSDIEDEIRFWSTAVVCYASKEVVTEQASKEVVSKLGTKEVVVPNVSVGGSFLNDKEQHLSKHSDSLVEVQTGNSFALLNPPLDLDHTSHLECCGARGSCLLDVIFSSSCFQYTEGLLLTDILICFRLIFSKAAVLLIFLD
ncbi:unnamed protein product [Amaranthus hypochondriacus]